MLKSFVRILKKIDHVITAPHCKITTSLAAHALTKSIISEPSLGIDGSDNTVTAAPNAIINVRRGLRNQGLSCLVGRQTDMLGISRHNPDRLGPLADVRNMLGDIETWAHTRYHTTRQMV